jgi:hypothetical protein
MTRKGITSTLYLAAIVIIIILSLTSCSKRDTACRFYIKDDLLLEHKTGKCYYYESNKKVYLDKETCANYCE